MALSPGNPDYRAAYQPSVLESEPGNGLPRTLFIVVVLLGLVTYGVSFGPVTDGGAATGWYVRFAALAALVAAFGQLRTSKPHHLAIAALAAMGFLDALAITLSATDPGWAMVVIVVLNALQAGAAVAALLIGAKAGPENLGAGYEAYVDYYNQAVRNYYSQQSPSAPPQQMQRSGQGQAYADAYTAPRGQGTQRPSEYADYASLNYADPRGFAPEHGSVGSAAPGATGLPNTGQADTVADETRRDSGQSAWPSSPI